MLGSLTRKQVGYPILYILLPLVLKNNSNEDHSGREGWEREGQENPHNSLRLHPDLDACSMPCADTLRVQMLMGGRQGGP